MFRQGIDIAILETTNPSDVTEVVGSGAVPMGLKAMIHVLAAKDRGIDLKSFGTLLDEPPTGLIFKASTKIANIQDLKGKKIGYIGHFGKIMVDDLMKQAGIPESEYTMVRVGMNVTDAIIRGDIDTGIGFTNFQRIELEELTGEPVSMLRIDELDGLGCCCFCSIQFVANQEWYDQPSTLLLTQCNPCSHFFFSTPTYPYHHRFDKNTNKLKGFMKAMRRAMDFTIEYPDLAWEVMCKANPRLNCPLYTKIFNRTLPYFSRDLNNVARDWNKVGDFCKHLNVLDTQFDQSSIWTNEHVPLTGTPSVLPVTQVSFVLDI